MVLQWLGQGGTRKGHIEIGMCHRTPKCAWSRFPGGLEKAEIQASQGYTENRFSLHLKIKEIFFLDQLSK